MPLHSFISTGRKDNSGLRFYYTSNIRKYDAGVLGIGEASLPYFVIPPKQKTWMTVGYCPKECSQVRCKCIICSRLQPNRVKPSRSRICYRELISGTSFIITLRYDSNTFVGHKPANLFYFLHLGKSQLNKATRERNKCVCCIPSHPSTRYVII